MPLYKTQLNYTLTENKKMNAVQGQQPETVSFYTSYDKEQLHLSYLKKKKQQFHVAIFSSIYKEKKHAFNFFCRQ